MIAPPACSHGAAAPQPDPVWQGIMARGVAGLRAALAAIPPGPAFLNSYVVLQGSADFDRTNENAAYSYDNALAGLALLAAGHPAEAARIADGFVIAQTHDRFWHDGRLRNAYRAGAVSAGGIVALPGWWDAAQNKWLEDPYQVGSESGPMAWLVLLWLALADRGINDTIYRAAAHLAALWLSQNLLAPAGFYGGFFGFEPNPEKLTWVSTEQNTDLAVTFGKMGMATASAHARLFVASMQERDRALFNAGLTPDGAVNHLIAADANIWPYLAGLSDGAKPDQAINALAQPPAAPRGIGFSSASDGIWCEGSAFAALALRVAGQPDEAARFGAMLAKNFGDKNLIFATVLPRISTGLTIGPGSASPKFVYFRRQSLSATSWSVLAALDVNPLST
jgi:hypothetical protein